MANRCGNNGKSEKLYFGGAPKSQQMVTAAMKLRCLLLGRKAMTNLESILKSRDITLLTKVHIVKAMEFPVVMYGCENWTIKNWTVKNWCFRTMVLEETLEGPLDCKKIKPVNLKWNQPWILIGRTDAEVKHAKSLLIRKDPDVGKDWRQEELGTARGRDG